MKYAVFSDIHGNYPALRAALDDAALQGVDQYLFIGDYYRSLPWPNETVDAIRAIPSAIVIQGNGEGYIPGLLGRIHDKKIPEQYKLICWSIKEFTQTNLDYLMSLPQTAVMENNGIPIHLHHGLHVFFRKPKLLPFHSSYYRNRMETEPFTHDEYLAFAKEAVLSHPGAVADLRALPQGVHLFGHNHLQFHMEFEGRLIVNPGSCGEPCDHDIRAAYTILERSADGWTVDERRVPYDVDAAVRAMRDSDFAAYAPVWARVIELDITTGKDYFSPFIQHIHATGQRLGKVSEPVADDVWQTAVETWEPEKLYAYD